jgi:hypothetical protein
MRIILNWAVPDTDLARNLARRISGPSLNFEVYEFVTKSKESLKEIPVPVLEFAALLFLC